MRYAVKIGEIHLLSDRPITEKERLEMLRLLIQHGYGDVFRLPGGTEAVTSLCVDEG